MNEQTKVALQIGALGLGGILLYALATRGNLGGSSDAGIPSATPAVPNYLKYNQPNLDSVPLDSSSGSTAAAPGSGCACGSTTNTLYSSPSAWQTSLDNSLGGFVQQYQDDVLNEFPDYVTQFFNDSQGAELSTQAQTTFANMSAQQ